MAGEPKVFTEFLVTVGVGEILIRQQQRGSNPQRQRQHKDDDQDFAVGGVGDRWHGELQSAAMIAIFELNGPSLRPV